MEIITKTMEISSASTTPRTVFTGEQFIVSIGVEDIITWMIERNENFMVSDDDYYMAVSKHSLIDNKGLNIKDSNGNYLQV